MSYTPQRSDATPWLFSRKETAQKLGICEGTVDNMVKRGELRAVWVGRRRMIPAMEVFRIVGVSETQMPKYLGYGDAWREDHPEN